VISRIAQSIVVAVAAWHNIGLNSKMIMKAREGSRKNLDIRGD